MQDGVYAASVEQAIRRSDAIHALDGYTPNAAVRAIDDAVLSGRATYEDAVEHLLHWVQERKTLDGFVVEE